MSLAVNRENMNAIQIQIAAKKGTEPYFACGKDVAAVLTDYDTFPYPRWFRGKAQKPFPIVAEREAGWRVRQDYCYEVNCDCREVPYPEHCFEPACSTVYPCLPSENPFDKRVHKINGEMEETCLVSFR